jgi:outer membrane protein OmpA-like peptidoglycan-associated protein
VQGVGAGKMAVVSGFHDASGDPAKNAELAKERALMVRDTLKALGVAEDKVELKKPEQTVGTGNPDEARRVEVMLK